MPDIDALALLDTEGGGRFVLVDGLPRAVDMHHLAVLRAIRDPRFFATDVAGNRPMTQRQVLSAHAAWIAENGLLSGDSLERLLYLLRRFWEPLEVDLQPRGFDLIELWQARRWRKLLNAIDHLPRACWSAQAMSNDPEYAEQIATAIQRQKDAREKAGEPEPEPTPPLIEWTPEVAALATVADAVNALRCVLIAANSKEGAPAPEFKAHPRPRTLMDTMQEKVQRKVRWSAHEKLAARVLPNRRLEQQTGDSA